MLAALLVVNKVRLFRRRHGAGRGCGLLPRRRWPGEAVRALAGRPTSRASLAALAPAVPSA